MAGNDGNLQVPSNLLSDSKLKSRFSPLLRQIFATIPSILCSMSAGGVVGYSAIHLPQLKEEGKEDDRFNFTSEQESWIASGAALSMAPSCIIGGFLMEMAGRKFTNIIVNLPFLIGWLFIYFSNGFSLFLIGRLIQGVSLGISGPLNSVFIGETTAPKTRGMFLAGVSLGYALGILWCHSLGTVLHWKLTAILCLCINLITSIWFIFIPESPSYSINKGDIKNAYRSFTWLRGFSEDAILEFNSMIKQHIHVSDNSSNNFNNSINLAKKENILDKLRQWAFWKALFILLGMFALLQFVGINAVAMYTVKIMDETVDANLSEYLCMILIDIVRFVIGILSCLVIKRIRRRPLFMVSGLGTGVSLVLLAIFLYIPKELIQELFGSYASIISFTPLILLISYISFSTVGLLPLPWCLIGELFPFNSRGLGSGIASSSNFILFFIVVKIAPFMFAVMGMNGSFLLYGCFGIFGTIFLYLFIPETMNKTLQEIESELSNKTTTTKDKNILNV